MFALDPDYQTPCSRDPEIFFSNRKAGVARAKALCASCRVQLICLHNALEFEELAGERLHGVHGGLTKDERAQTKLTRIA